MKLLCPVVFMSLIAGCVADSDPQLESLDSEAKVVASCRIGGAIYATHAVNPANTCESCQPAVSRKEWTALPNGTTDGTACGSDIGECVAGVEMCFGGVLECVGAIDASSNPESCNGRDDDCDGEVDEGIGAVCGGSCTVDSQCAPPLHCVANVCAP